MHSAAVDADESWGAIGSLSVMVAALPAQEELYFAFTAARRRGRTAHVSSIQTRTFLEGTSTACYEFLRSLLMSNSSGTNTL